MNILGDRPTEMLLVLGTVSLAPIALVMLTSFVKISVVLSIARSALGAPQVPPSSVVTGLALLLSAYVMAPVARDSYAAAHGHMGSGEVKQWLAAGALAAEPLRAFLTRLGRPDDRAMFLDLAQQLRGKGRAAEVHESDFAVLAPAFVISELRRAFTIGFLVFLPFLVVDLLVANLLVALGMAQLSPTTIALPFKLILFVAVDGWKLLARGLTLSYLA